MRKNYLVVVFLGLIILFSWIYLLIGNKTDSSSNLENKQWSNLVKYDKRIENKVDDKKVKSKEGEVEKGRDDELTYNINKKDISIYVNTYYLQPWKNLFELEDNLRIELYNKFDEKKFQKYIFLAYLRGDYEDVERLINYYRIKFWKDLLKNFVLKRIRLHISQPVDKVVINDKVAEKVSDRIYEYVTYFPFNFNIIIYKKGCVPYIKKMIGYIGSKDIEIGYNCIPLHIVNCGTSSNNDVVNFKKFQIRLANICSDHNIKRLEYAYLDHDEAKSLGFLDLPVFDEYGYRLIAQWFNSYGMPIVIMRDEKGDIVNKCIPIFYKYKGSNLKNFVNLPENKYMDAIYWQKQWLPWWWNLDLHKWIWYVWYQQLYDRTRGIFLIKYCYKF